MKIAIIQDGAVVHTGEYQDVFPSTSFTEDGPNDDFLLENNAKKINYFKSHDRLTQKLVSVEPHIEGDSVYAVQVQPLSDSEIQQQKASAMDQIKAIRDQLLRESDWTQLMDIAENTRNLWSAYRRTLRNLPNTITEPRTFTDWPAKPSASKD